MLSLELPINVVVLLAMMAISCIAGFALRSRQLSKARVKLLTIENEIIRSHAEILDLQKEFLAMELKLQGIKDPVIVMKNISHAESNEKLPNAALRKKMLTKDLTLHAIKAMS